ncbi:MAG: histidine phosphatase family protein, partial [Oscillospiraceae bacterium]
MTTIYLIRHAEAEGNLYRIAHGQYDSILTDRGLAQVEALQQRFADIPVDAVYSSDLRRACQTAAALFVPKGLPLQKRRDLREVSMGVWEQKTWGEIEQ